MTPGSPLPSPLCLSLTSRFPVAKTYICLRWKDHNWLPVWFLLLKHHTSPSLNEERMLEKHFTHSGGRGGWLECAQLERSLARAASTQLLQEGQRDTILGISDPHKTKSLASMSKNKWRQLWVTLEVWEEAGSIATAIKGPHSSCIFTLLSLLLRFYLLRNPSNGCRLIQPCPAREAEAGTFPGTFLLNSRAFCPPWDLWENGVCARHDKIPLPELPPSLVWSKIQDRAGLGKSIQVYPGGINGNPLQYSCLEKTPWTEEPRGL